MSVVSNQILCVGWGEGENWLEPVNAAMQSEYGAQFRELDYCEEVGGSKCWEGNTALAAFNHVTAQHTLEVLDEIEWKRPELLQLIVQEQEEEQFTIHRLPRFA